MPKRYSARSWMPPEAFMPTPARPFPISNPFQVSRSAAVEAPKNAAKAQDDNPRGDDLEGPALPPVVPGSVSGSTAGPGCPSFIAPPERSDEPALSEVEGISAKKRGCFFIREFPLPRFSGPLCCDTKQREVYGHHGRRSD